jgi:hypothetical protein
MSALKIACCQKSKSMINLDTTQLISEYLDLSTASYVMLFGFGWLLIINLTSRRYSSSKFSMTDKPRKLFIVTQMYENTLLPKIAENPHNSLFST